MIGLIGLLPGEFLFELCKFVIMLVLLVAGVAIGAFFRKKSDAKKEAKALAHNRDNNKDKEESNLID